MKYIPNILSFMRLVAIVPLLLLTPFKFPFMMIYVLAGITDMIDGPIARKFNVVSKFGAALDGGADMLLILVVLFRLLPIIDLSNWIIVWIFIAIGMKFFEIAAGYLRHKELILLHTYLSKFFAFSLFLFPVFYLFIEADIILTVVLIIATITFVEGIYINATSKKVDLDDKGILFRDKS